MSCFEIRTVANFIVLCPTSFQGIFVQTFALVEKPWELGCFSQYALISNLKMDTRNDTVH